MQIKSFDDLNFTHIDVLRELGNIGMGNAATALSQMLSNKVEMSVPVAELLDKEQAADYLKKLQTTSLGIVLKLSGDMKGSIIHILRKSFAERIINFFFPASIDNIEDIDDMSMSVISEVGNITSASYVNALASMTGMFIDISTPTPCPDLVEAVLNPSETNADANFGNSFLFIDNSFYIDHEEIKSNLILLPEANSLNMIFEKLGLED